jgi:hypothetical protein
MCPRAPDAASPAEAREETMRRIAIAGLACVLAACATYEAEQAPTDPMGRAVTAPLTDLNLLRAKIPPPLAAALESPYGPPVDGSCAGLAVEVAVLDTHLGADLDTADTAATPSVIERGISAVSDAAVGTVRGAAEGVVPMRSWVRKLSGAERHTRLIASAAAAGVVRRSFLKGLGAAGGCAPPAGPRR